MAMERIGTVVRVVVLLCTAVLLGSCIPGTTAGCDRWLRPGFDDDMLASLTSATVDAWLDDYIAEYPYMTLNHRRVYDFPRIDATLYDYQLEDKNLPAIMLFQFSFQADGTLLVASTYSGFIDIFNGEIEQCLGTPDYIEAYHSDKAFYFALWYPERGIAVVYTASRDFADEPPTLHEKDATVRDVFLIPPHIRDEWSQEEIARLVRRNFALDYPDSYPLQPWPGGWEAIKSIKFQE